MMTETEITERLNLRMRGAVFEKRSGISLSSA